MASRTVLRGRIEKKGGRRSSLKSRRSALLNMPIDLIREITDELSPADKIIFATTCRAIRNTVGRGQFPSDTYEDRQERFEYLASMCRDMPNHWVCEECMRYHRIDTSDTPVQSRPTCPLADRYGRYNQPLTLSPGDEYELGRRHVQLALKYTRMGDSLLPRHRQYLRRLTAARQYSLSYPWETKMMVTAKIIPRIVDGRFLLRSLCEYRQSSKPVTRELIACESVCPHQQVFPPRDDDWSNDAFHQNLRQFHKAVNDSFETPGKEMRSHCPHCFTDFSVTTTTKCIRVSVWMDLGTESSPLDPVWRSFVHSADLDPIGEVEYNELGRVRELYSSGEE
ncbi:hypothetical protein TASIC1_0005049200 [Trichoderma asperellum]|uniref:F-box domain-containing protein n=1 Tax=Trichoderma asperellum TaxID=101201 RepID=A0A6V8QSQ5_TRIAP|nr:hypothetical protein LI328DRAFT_165994 [Trichoderma asperelloides]GFP55634.1 hypothetical protein TASIC1_0005049200 [Trichoderma asperellum]